VSAVGELRTRSFSWVDPAAASAAGVELPGLDYIRGIADGTFPAPPIAMLLGFEIVAAEPGRAVFAMEPAEWMYNPIGSVHGGVAATILDSCLGCAVHTTLDAGSGYATSDLHVRYVRSISADTGTVHAEGRVIHRGRRLATAEGRLFVAADGTLLAHGTTACQILGG
jgi:uncharacterized protein (TIGR00369 family)